MLFNNLAMFVGSMSNAMRYCGADVYTVVKNESYNINLPFVDEFLDCMDSGFSVEKSWKKAVSNIPLSYGLTLEDKRVINQFGIKLGATDIDGQMNHCEYFKNAFIEKANSLKFDYTSKSKVYRSLGFFGGLAVSIILI